MSLDMSQNTIAKRINLHGVGVHSGSPVAISLVPAEPGTGVIFHRIDIEGQRSGLVKALSTSVGATDLSTAIGNMEGVGVQTIEHLMAALSALSIDNLIVEIDSHEVPVMDGSSRAFVQAIDEVGTVRQNAPRRMLKVLKPVRVAEAGSWSEFVPAETRQFDIEIDFESEAVGRQRMEIDLTADVFRNEIADARTFGFMSDVERLWAAGYALGSSLDNSVVICAESGIINPEGLRFEDEFVRHKLLDAIGDLSLVGYPIIGLYRSYRGGHRMNAAALAELLSDSGNYEIVLEDTLVSNAGKSDAAILSLPNSI